MATDLIPAVPPERTTDIAFESHDSIVLIRGLSEAGQAWLDENVGDDETQYFGNAIAAEPRYCLAIILGAQREGLAVLGMSTVLTQHLVSPENAAPQNSTRREIQNVDH